MARALSIRLGSLGYDCVTAHDGEAGLERFDQGGIDLVITDVNMPRQSGFDVGETIRKASDVPIIVITGFAETFPPVLVGPGGITFVFKPIDWKRLLRVVEAKLGVKGAETVK
jgi:two-component system response regulator RegX3